MMTALIVVIFGAVIACEPSLGTSLANTVGKVSPPSVDMRMSTLAQLIGDEVVPATFHVTVWELLPAQLVVVLTGDVTAKGVAVATEVIFAAT